MMLFPQCQCNPNWRVVVVVVVAGGRGGATSALCGLKGFLRYGADMRFQ